MLRKFINFTEKQKIVRGMISYGLLWPTASLIEQTLAEKRNYKTYDWARCLRYSFFGFFFMGPTLYAWTRLLPKMYPQTNLRTSVVKALLEQISYEPFSITAFLYFMSLMEGKSRQWARHEVSVKFFDAYKVAIVYWPIVQTINFSMIPLKNQVVFTSFFSLFWSSFLSYLKCYENVETDMTTDTHEIVLLVNEL